VSARSDRVLAVLDTSFWILAYRAEITANCLDLVDIIVPNAVAKEIMVGEPGAAAREYPYATLFRHLQHELRTPDVHVTPLGIFGPGEAEAIALAAELKALLLINERPGLHYARNLGLDVASVPAVIVLLRSQGVISDRAARRKLGLIAPNTAQTIIDEASRALGALRGGD
jgi:predicted nucleic acid-binding protein